MQKTFVASLGRLSALALLSTISFLAAHPAHAAERIGVAAAVKPQATSQPPGGTMRTLKIGKEVVYNERIDTSDSGVVQVLLLDGSTFTVGPKSSLVIDKFVYNPRTGTGELAASFSKGALRFIGGKLSKTEPGVKVKTPAGTLTVRGGIFQGVVRNANQAVFAFVFGHHLSLSRHGRRYTINQTGNLFSINGSGAPVIRPATPTDINLILAAVSGHSWSKIIKVKGNGWPFYYGIQPTGRYPDEPFVRQLYYDGPFTGRLTRVPQPQIVVPNSHTIVTTPHVDHMPPPVTNNNTTPTTNIPGKP